jgi:hypothetical protein
MATWAWIVIVIAILVIVAVAAVLTTRQRRRAGLQDRFGPEYTRTVESAEDRRAAENELLNREKQRAKLDIKPLTEASRERYIAQWRVIQERFVDEPADAASSADRLVHSVMAERGYPMGDFAAQSDLVSVDYPEIAENYRVAHAIGERANSGQVSTEDLREGLLRYRSLFNELLGNERPDNDPDNDAAPAMANASAQADTAQTDTAQADTAQASTAQGSTAQASTVLASAPAVTPAMDPDASAQSIPAHHGTAQGPADRETGNDSA